MKIQKGSKLVMIGDSITDCGRSRPVGEGLGDTHGVPEKNRGDVRICTGASPQVAMRQAEGTCQAGLGGLGRRRRQASNRGRGAILRVGSQDRLVHQPRPVRMPPA